MSLRFLVAQAKQSTSPEPIEPFSDGQKPFTDVQIWQEEALRVQLMTLAPYVLASTAMDAISAVIQEYAACGCEIFSRKIHGEAVT